MFVQGDEHVGEGDEHVCKMRSCVCVRACARKCGGDEDMCLRGGHARDVKIRAGVRAEGGYLGRLWEGREGDGNRVNIEIKEKKRRTEQSASQPPGIWWRALISLCEGR